MEIINFYINVVVLVLSLAYGISFGIKNLFKRMIIMMRFKEVRQSEIGKFMDALFVVSLVYFATFGRDFILGLI